MISHIKLFQNRTPWNKNKVIGQKAPLKLKEIWAIRVRLQMKKNPRNFALFNLAIDSKLRGCDLVKFKVNDICQGAQILHRASILQQKTQRPVQFEITPQTRESVLEWIRYKGLQSGDYLFPSQMRPETHIGTRQYAWVVESWVASIGLNPAKYGTHTMRRTKASLIYRRTKNLRAVQLLLGHTKLESTVRYLGIEVDDAIEMAEMTEA